MSTTTLSVRRAVPVVIGGVTVWCEGFKASAVRSITESPTADGGTVFTGNSLRSTRLIFSGRICSADSTGVLLSSFDALVRTDNAFDVEYMGLSFTDCCMLAYSFSDSGGDWTDVSVTLLTASPIEGGDAS